VGAKNQTINSNYLFRGFLENIPLNIISKLHQHQEEEKTT
jgi:hypothetical protein